jgi:signal transduction histidine kinase
MLLFLLLIVLVPVLIMQLGVYYSRYEARRSQELRANLELARAMAISFDGYIQDVLRQELAIGTAITSQRPMPDEQVDHLLVQSAKQYPALREFFWLTPEGRVVASSNPDIVGVEVPDPAYFQEIANGREWMVSDLIQAPVGGDPVFTIVRGIRDEDGTLLGMVGASVKPERLHLQALPLERAGQGTFTVIDRQGRIVYRSPAVDLPWEQREVADMMPFVNEVRAGRDVADDFISAVDGDQKLGGFTPITSLGWVAAASRPEAVVMAPVRDDLLRDAGLFFLVSLGAFVVAMLTSRRLTRPVARLRAHALALGGGDLDQRVVVAGPTELADLGATFNKMTEQIKAQQEALQSQNEELQVMNEELQAQQEELQAQNEELRVQAEEIKERQQEAERLLGAVEAANKDLEAFSYSVSHDLRAPLRSIDGFSQALLEDYADQLDAQGKDYLQRVRVGTQRMGRLIDDMLTLSRISRREMRREWIDLSAIAGETAAELQRAEPERQVELDITPGLGVTGDAQLLRAVLDNLLGNAWKFTSKQPWARIEFGATKVDGRHAYFVRDNGAGFDMSYADKLFGAFQRLHAESDFPGSGIGLATVQRIIRRHGGQVWAEGQVGRGATFYFTVDGSPTSGV